MCERTSPESIRTGKFTTSERRGSARRATNSGARSSRSEARPNGRAAMRKSSEPHSRPVATSSSSRRGGSPSWADRSARRPRCDARNAPFTAAVDDHVHEPVLHGLLGGHVAVAVGVVVDLLRGLAGVLRVELVEPSSEGERLAGVDLDVRRLALVAARRLVDEHAAVGQRLALAGRAGGEDQRAHRHRDAAADRLHVGRDVLHRVVDGEAGVDDAAGAVDVEADVAVGVGGFEVQQLRDDEVRDLVVDRLAEEDDALVEQAAVDVERALAASVLLDDHRDEGHVARVLSVSRNSWVALCFGGTVACGATVQLHVFGGAPMDVSREIVLPVDRRQPGTP